MGGKNAHGGVPVREPQLVPKPLILGNGLQNFGVQPRGLAVGARVDKGAEIVVRGNDPCARRCLFAAARQQEKRRQRPQRH